MYVTRQNNISASSSSSRAWRRWATGCCSWLAEFETTPEKLLDVLGHRRRPLPEMVFFRDFFAMDVDSSAVGGRAAINAR